jgi:hypothetical protein
MKRRKMAELLKTVVTILRDTKQPGIRRLAHTLVDQLVELVPELKRLSIRYGAGEGQLLDGQGRSTGRSLPLDFFLEPSE